MTKKMPYRCLVSASLPFHFPLFNSLFPPSPSYYSTSFGSITMASQGPQFWERYCPNTGEQHSVTYSSQLRYCGNCSFENPHWNGGSIQYYESDVYSVHEERRALNQTSSRPKGKAKAKRFDQEQPSEVRRTPTSLSIAATPSQVAAAAAGPSQSTTAGTSRPATARPQSQDQGEGLRSFASLGVPTANQERLAAGRAIRAETSFSTAGAVAFFPPTASNSSLSVALCFSREEV